MKYSQFSTDGYPLWLYYYRQDTQLAGCSPVTPFNPAEAMDGNPYASTTSPSAALNKKTLVVTPDVLHSLEERAILRHLHLAGFSLILCCDDKSTLIKPEDRFELPTAEKLTYFSETAYSRFVDDYHLTHDQIEVLQGEIWDDLRFALRVNSYIHNTIDQYGPGIENIEITPYGISAFTDMLGSLEKFCCFSFGVYHDHNQGTYYISQYDAKICDYLISDNNVSRPLNITFSPEVLADKHALKSFSENRAFMDKLSGESLCQLGKADINIAREILARELHMRKIFTWLNFIQVCGAHAELSEETKKWIESYKEQFPSEFQTYASYFFFLENPSSKLIEYILAELKVHNTFIALAPEQCLLQWLDDEHANFSGEDFLYIIGFKYESVAKKIVEKIVEQKILMELENSENKKNLLWTLGIKYVSIAQIIINTPQLSDLFNTNEMQTIVQPNLVPYKKLMEYGIKTTIEMAKQAVINESSFDDYDYWEKIWIAHPILANYIKTTVLKNLSPRPTSSFHALTHMTINKKELLYPVLFNESGDVFNREWECMGELRSAPFNLSNIQSISITCLDFPESIYKHDTEINKYERRSRDEIGEPQDPFALLIDKCPLLSEIQMPEYLKQRLDKAGFKFINKQQQPIHVTTWDAKNKTAFNAPHGEINPTSPEEMSDLGFLYADNSLKGPLSALNAADDHSHVHFQEKPLWAIKNPAHRTSFINRNLTEMMHMSWQDIFVYKGNQAEFVEPKKLLSLAVDLSVTQSDEVQLILVNFDSLKQLQNGGYIIPVLTPEQRLTFCKGGSVHTDEFGRWIFYPHSTNAIQKCQLEIAIPKITKPAAFYINSKNMHEKQWDSIPHINKIRNFFTSEYEQDNATDLACGDRVKKLLRQKPKDSSWFLGGSGSGLHAYLIIQNDKKQFIRVNLGGSSNYLEEYSAVPDAMKKTLLINNAINEQMKITNEPKLQDILSNAENTRILFQASDSLVPSLIEWGKNHGETTLLIEHFSQFDFDKKTLKIHQDKKTVCWENDGFLADFLKKATENPDKHFRIIILWDKLTAQQRVRVNTLLEKTIQNKPLPDNLYITGITQKDLLKLDKMDDSFTSRHNCQQVVSPTMQQNFETEILKNGISNISDNISDSHIPIDLSGYSDWKSALLGPLILNNNQINWTPTENFSNYFLDENNADKIQSFTLNNIPAEHRAAATEYIERSKALGYFLYHGLEIPFPSHCSVTISNLSFDFKNVGANNIRPNSINSTNSTVWINTYLFDHLLQTKEIHGGQYKTLPGMIEQAKGGSLTVKLTSALSEGQWYCLLSEAKKHDVLLTFELAPGVQTPNNLNIEQSPIVINAQNIPRVFLSNDINQSCETLYNEDKNALVIDVEDFSYQDLFFTETYEMTDGTFKNFVCKKTELLEALEDGRSVILKGDFSAAFLQYLHPVLATGRIEQSGQSVQLKGQLTLIIETPQLTNQDNDSRALLEKMSLSWLPSAKAHYQTPIQKKAPRIIQEPCEIINWNALSLSDLSKEKSDHFINARKKLILEASDKSANRDRGQYSSPWLLLTGETGSGKSRVLQLIKETEQKTCAVYYDIEEWAADKSNKKKILFFDEYNLQNKHLTAFASLESTPPFFFHKGKILVLDENHKLFCAGNPLNYGSGRVEQKFFTRYKDTIPEIQFSPFPPAYIYQEILLPIYKKSANFIQHYISEADFQKTCLALMTHSISVRKIQEDILNYLSTTAQEKHSTFFAEKIFKNPVANDKKYTHQYTPEQEAIFNILQKKFQLRTNQLLNRLPSQGIGNNGILITGGSGVGKTTIVEEALHTKDRSDYIKIDASLSISKQKEYLLKGFREGLFMWIDELDSLLDAVDNEQDDFLEKWINAILTGKDPETGLPQPAEARQCLLIVTANKADREGRSIMSPALMDRFQHYHVKETHNYRQQSNRSHVGVNNNIRPEPTAASYFRGNNENPDLALSILKKIFAKIETEYAKKTQFTFMKNPERLDAIQQIKKIVENAKDCSSFINDIKKIQEDVDNDHNKGKKKSNPSRLSVIISRLLEEGEKEMAAKLLLH